MIGAVSLNVPKVFNMMEHALIVRKLCTLDSPTLHIIPRPHEWVMRCQTPSMFHLVFPKVEYWVQLFSFFFSDLISLYMELALLL